MIDGIDCDSYSSPHWINQGSSAPLEETAPVLTKPVDEAASSLRSSQRRLRGSIFSLDLSTARRESDLKAVQNIPSPKKQLNDKATETAIKAFKATSKKSEVTIGKAKKHKHKFNHTLSSAGEYLFGIGEMVLGGTLMITGAAIEIGSLGTLTIAVGFQEAAGCALIGDGFARTMRNRDISFDRSIPPATWKSTDSLYKKGSVDPNLPANPDDLLKKPEWKETTHPEAGKNGHRTFENKETGEKLRHDKGNPGKPGHEGYDHYHRQNPNKTGKHDEYLDNEYKPVGRNSDRSHIYSPENIWWKE